MTFNLQVMILISTVKQGYSKNGYNVLTLTVRLFSFPVTLFYVVNLIDIINFAKSPVPSTLLKACFTEHCIP